MSKEFNVAIAGATGAVGIEMIKTLEKRNFPVRNLCLLASKRSAGRKLRFKGEEVNVEELTDSSFKGIDIALFSAGAGRSREFASSATREGAIVIDNSSAFRMDVDVPLVVPEVNPGDAQLHKGIIANPNCTTIIMVVVLKPLYDLSRIKRITVCTYQSASGAGAKAMEELKIQAQQVLNGELISTDAFPYQIAFNLFSHNSKIDNSGYCEEERKMIYETRKIMHDESLKICPTTIRVPVFRAHSECLTIEQERKVSVIEARAALARAPGITIVDDPEKNYFPMPIDVTGFDEVAVGRIRNDESTENGLACFICGDQLLKGAALNAVQIAELL